MTLSVDFDRCQATKHISHSIRLNNTVFLLISYNFHSLYVFIKVYLLFVLSYFLCCEGLLIQLLLKAPLLKTDKIYLGNTFSIMHNLLT